LRDWCGGRPWTKKRANLFSLLSNIIIWSDKRADWVKDNGAGSQAVRLAASFAQNKNGGKRCGGCVRGKSAGTQFSS